MEVLGYVVLLFLLAFLAGAGAGIGASGQRPGAMKPARSRHRTSPAAAQDEPAGIGHERAVP